MNLQSHGLHFYVNTQLKHCFRNILSNSGTTRKMSPSIKCTKLVISAPMGSEPFWNHISINSVSKRNWQNKWPFYDHFWPFFCQLYIHLSQNRFFAHYVKKNICRLNLFSLSIKSLYVYLELQSTHHIQHKEISMWHGGGKKGWVKAGTECHFKLRKRRFAINMRFTTLSGSDVGLRSVFLCGARTSALQKLFRTHLRTHLDFWVIALAPALALFFIISYIAAIFWFQKD